MLEKLMKSNVILINLYGYFLYIKRYPQYMRQRLFLKRNQELSNAIKNQKCFIICTGPSLKNVDLLKLDADTFVVNNFYKYNVPESFNPTYAMIIDGDFYEQGDLTIASTVKKYPHTKLILNGKYQNLMAASLSNENIFYIDIWNGYFSCKKKLDFSKVESSFINVSCCAVAYAMYLGYKEIYLLGCDFSSFASRNPNYCYLEPNIKKSPLINELYGYAIATHTHMALAQYAQMNGVKIVNVTNSSLLDAYPQDEELYFSLLKNT